MGRYICHKDGVFFEWSTIVDAPVSYGMNEKEFRLYHKHKYGDLPADERIERAIHKGTSSFNDESLQDLIFHNRAGPDETNISLEEIMKSLNVLEDSP